MRSVAFAALAALGLAGCASNPVYEGGRAWNQGWREGKVEKVASAPELGYRHTFDCRYRAGGPGRDATGVFAVVGLQNMGRHRHHVVPVEPGKEPRVGDQMLTNHRGCEPPIAGPARARRAEAATWQASEMGMGTREEARARASSRHRPCRSSWGERELTLTDSSLTACSLGPLILSHRAILAARARVLAPNDIWQPGRLLHMQAPLRACVDLDYPNLSTRGHHLDAPNGAGVRQLHR